MKEFVVYTALRLLLFVASLAIIGGGWALVTGDTEVPALWTVLVAFLVSGVASVFLLNRQREALARRVAIRADAASAKFEETRGKED